MYCDTSDIQQNCRVAADKGIGSKLTSHGIQLCGRQSNRKTKQYQPKHEARVSVLTVSGNKTFIHSFFRTYHPLFMITAARYSTPYCSFKYQIPFKSHLSRTLQSHLFPPHRPFSCHQSLLRIPTPPRLLIAHKARPTYRIQ